MVHLIQRVFDKWCNVEDYPWSFHMGQEREICRGCISFHAKDVKTNLSVPYDSGGENYWSLASYDKCDKTYNYIGSHKDMKLLQLV